MSLGRYLSFLEYRPVSICINYYYSQHLYEIVIITPVLQIKNLIFQRQILTESQIVLRLLVIVYGSINSEPFGKLEEKKGLSHGK